MVLAQFSFFFFWGGGGGGGGGLRIEVLRLGLRYNYIKI